MNIPHDKFCVLPWVSLEASPIGTVRPCCLAYDEIVDDRGVKVHLSNMSFDDIRETNHMRSLRREFLQGVQPNTCRRCWAEEDSGRTSKRMHTLDDTVWTEDAKPLMFLDLKLGNICNLKCRICGSWSSSTFAVEELAHSKQPPKETFHYAMLQQGRWPRESEEFWAELETHMSEIRYLEFTGGEPFMIEEHFDLLQKLVDRGHAEHIEIHYNTNGTVWPAQAESIWQHFRHVEIAFSIDDVGERFEYQRSNAVWSEVTENIQRFRLMRARNNNISLQVCCTINVFNVLYLVDVACWIAQQDFDFVYWNMLHDAPQHCIANLPESAKQDIAKHLKQCDFPAQFQSDIQGAIDFMMSRPGMPAKELIKNLQQLDQRRGQNLAKVEPELAKILNYEKA